ncbi:MAG: LPS-assembly protein LptD [Mailhella sp.]|nr:LPS-assembly protein LptD [Mailhella sp.]
MPSEASASVLNVQKSINTRGDAPWNLKADKLVSIDDGVIVEASGGVLIQRGNDYMKADFARYYTATNWIFAQGNVEVRMGRDILNAREAEFDLNSRVGWMKEGSVFMAGPHMYVSGKQVDKLFGDRYVFKNARVTLCDGDRPAWAVDADEAEVEVDGYATLRHTTLNILDVPVMDAPFMMLPAKTSRQSGLLFPDMGYSSLNGAFYSQPYYHVIDESRDLTFYATYMGRSGFMPGIEYRSHTREKDKTWLALDMLYDKHTFSNDFDDRVDSGDGKINTSKERFWLRGMADGYIGDSQWRYRYNLDYVSDQNYLREFRTMMNGFNRSRDSMYDLFGRDIAEVDENRVSEGFVYREWDKAMVAFGFRYEQIPYLGHGNRDRSEDTTVQRMPLNAYLYKGRIFENIPVELQGEVSTAYEYRSKGVRGLRTEIHPELSVPVSLPGMSIILNGGVRQTWYNSSHYHKIDNDKATRGGGSKDRIVPEASAMAFTQFSRVWQMPERALEASEENLGKSRWVGIKHRLQPRVTYGWIPDRDQSENPIFEEMDRIKPSEQMRFGVTNIFTTKSSTVSRDKEGFVLRESFRDPIRWEIASGYDFEEAKRHMYRDEFSRKPWMDAYSHLEFSPLDWFSLGSKMYVSMYGDGLTRTDSSITFRNQRWGWWRISYDVRNNFYNYRDEMKRDKRSDMRFTGIKRLLTNTLNLKLSKMFDVYFETDDDIITGHNLGWESVLAYRHQCFHILTSIERDGRDTAFRVMLQFPGFNL